MNLVSYLTKDFLWSGKSAVHGLQGRHDKTTGTTMYLHGLNQLHSHHSLRGIISPRTSPYGHKL